MRVLQIGAGSMGRRRLRDLRALGVEELLLYEPQEDRCKEIASLFGVPGFIGFEEALSQDPEVMVISTPPALHGSYVKKAMDRQMHVFAEVPFVYDVELMESIAEQAACYPAVLGISHTIRFHPPMRLIRDLVKQARIGRPLYMEHSLGNYLPDWHPYEDYRRFYASDAKLGGAGMDMLLWELSVIQWWLGPVKSVYTRFSKVSALEVEGPDCHDILLDFESGARGFFHHDIIEQGTQGRHVRLVGDRGTIEWHQSVPEIRFFDGSKKAAEKIPLSKVADWEEAVKATREMRAIQASVQVETGRSTGSDTDAKTSPPQQTHERESDYLREMSHFLGAIRGENPFTLVTVAEELQNLRAFHAILTSAQKGEAVSVN